jgi:hypothetical protein
VEDQQKINSDLADHLRIAEKCLRSIEHLAHGPNSCDHKMVQQYALQALGRVQAARHRLGDETKV